ncbi:MAG: carbonic anhydrase [Gammaproteobacteria bacterium]|nr:carbonic anhydrase [Gammaproteobacteria bacterium]
MKSQEKTTNNIANLLNRGFASHLSTEGSKRSGEPGHRVVIVTCMDTRINPYRIFNLSEGEVHLLRNAGGVITSDVIRSILISQRLLNTCEVLVVQHTKCGMATFDGEQFKDDVERETHHRPEFEMCTFKDVYENVKSSLQLLHDNVFLTRTTHIRGFVYDVDEDRLEEVVMDR